MKQKEFHQPPPEQAFQDFDHKLQSSDYAALRAEKITDATGLWLRIGSNYDQGVPLLAGQTGIPKERLMQYLDQQVQIESARQKNDFYRTNPFWPFVLAVVAFALLLIVRGLPDRAAVPLWPVVGPAQTATAGIAPYSPVTPDQHVRVWPVAFPPVSGVLFEEGYGRYAIHAVGRGEVITAGDFSEPYPLAIPRRVLTIPIAAAQNNLVKPGRWARLVFSPKVDQPESAAAEVQALVLGYTEIGDGAIVSFAEPDLEHLRTRFSICDIYLTRP